MDFEQMKALEPELPRLETSVRFAGQNQADWIGTLMATHEALLKAVGRGARLESLQSAEAYEIARAALHKAWECGAK